MASNPWSWAVVIAVSAFALQLLLSEDSLLNRFQRRAPIVDTQQPPVDSAALPPAPFPLIPESLRPHSLFVRNNVQGLSRIGACAAIGGNAEFRSGMSVAESLDMADFASKTVLMVGGSLRWLQGACRGNIQYGSSSDTRIGDRILYPGCSSSQAPFSTVDSMWNDARYLSKQFAAMPETVTSKTVDSTGCLTVKLPTTNTNTIQVMNVPFDCFWGHVNHVMPIDNCQGKILVINIPGKVTGVFNVNFDAWKSCQVVFNFYESAIVDFRGTTLYGIMVAPCAEFASTTGSVYGQVFAREVSGPLVVLPSSLNFSLPTQFTWVKTGTLGACPTVPPAIPDITPSENVNADCIDVGDLKRFNVLVNSMYMGSSYVGGRLAVGGKADICGGFSLAFDLNNIPCEDYSLIVGGKVSWPADGTGYGSCKTGGLIAATKDVPIKVSDCIFQTNSNVNPGIYDFGKADTFFKTLSRTMANWRSTVTTEVDDAHKMNLIFSNRYVEVLNVLAYDFMWSTSFINTIQNRRAGSVLVINICGAFAGLTNMNMEAFKGIPVIFNFYQATHVSLRGLTVQGTVLAPYAAAYRATGNVNGSMYINTLTGALTALWPKVGDNFYCPVNGNPLPPPPPPPPSPPPPNPPPPGPNPPGPNPPGPNPPPSTITSSTYSTMTTTDDGSLGPQSGKSSAPTVTASHALWMMMALAMLLLV